MFPLSLFHRKKPAAAPSVLISAERQQHRDFSLLRQDETAQQLYRQLRYAVPIIDAALSKIVRLTGSYSVIASDPAVQKQLDAFVQQIPCDFSSQGLQSFTDRFLDSLLTCGNALGELLVDSRRRCITGLHCAEPDLVCLKPGKSGRAFFLRMTDGSPEERPLPHPERLLFCALHPPAGQIYGVSVLHGIPALCSILLRIYECIGQNYDRIGNIRYAVTYHPSNDPTERAYTTERVKAIAKEWAAGMRDSSSGEVRDFICAGDVDIKVIGAENPLLDTEIPVRQLLEQIVSSFRFRRFCSG
ncbi:MAG: serine/threonine protein phosphatase [Ruminococcus sp.]